MAKHSVWIEVFNLRNGVYEYKFLIDDGFFNTFEHSIIQKAKLNAYVQLRKTSHGMDTKLYLHGEITVPCDMCAEEFIISIQAKDEVVYRYKEGYSEQEKEKLEEREQRELRWVSIIDKQIDVGQELYEVAHIQIPMKLCPAQKDGVCLVCKRKPQEWLNQIGKPDSDSDYIDPRWNDLKKIKF
ncbi:MAG: DUF177 domain-containing protein [Bacteroidia bacterium]|nr:DUF177 domain-containing protein [Bacteroidia bacterium]MDW8347142.1 DUF177 domain-containing protein [Bacteroidia bacterium]